jgi:hypothetical protein
MKPVRKTLVTIRCACYILIFFSIPFGANAKSYDKLVKELAVVNLTTDKGAYYVNETVKLSYTLSNSNATPVHIREVNIQIRDLANPAAPLIFKKNIQTDITIAPNGKQPFTTGALWHIPADAIATAYGIYLEYVLQDGSRISGYQSFFRVVNKGDLTCYGIDHTTYKGLNVYMLHGGMSAEYVVEKAAENLTGGIAHSWYVNAPGSGPEHVLATPQFLEKSVHQTVDFYNNVLGANTTFETVIIGVGIPSVPYLSRALKAPVLPLHFLASSNTVKEIQSILNYSNQNGYPAYATLGHDASVPMAVTWVKLLKMPAPYLNFLKQHRVKNIVFVGFNGEDGENTAKLVLQSSTRRTNASYQPGDLFVLYPGGGSDNDVKELKDKIKDYEHTTMQPDYVRIADWESGIIAAQIANFAKAAKAQAGIQHFRTVTSKSMIALWDLGAYVALKFMHKNQQPLTAKGAAPLKGITFNPYLIGQPVYESLMGYIPLLYWQLNPPQSTVDRLNEAIKAAVMAYSPDVSLSALSCWVNSSNNFGAATSAMQLINTLRTNKYDNIRENDYTVDEIWNPADGMQAPVELRAAQLLQENWTSASIKAWDHKLKALTLTDLDELGQRFPDIQVKPLTR